MQSYLAPNHIQLALLHVMAAILETGIFSPNAGNQIQLLSVLGSPEKHKFSGPLLLRHNLKKLKI